jgi:hypothetical protein
MCGEWQIINFGRAIEREVTALVEREFAKRSIKNYPIYQAGRMDATRDASHQPSASATADAKPADGVLSDALTDALAEIERLNAIINTPHADDFMRSVSIEAEHQRQRWGAEGDAGKTPADWFWLVGYLAGKALHSHAAGNVEKGEHHVITTAAACANWHRALFGKTDMRPGHEEGSGLLVAAQPEGEGS